jgi:hypothetical protein
MSMQAYLDNIEAKTGITPAKFIELAQDKGFDSATKAGEMIQWLAADYGLGRGHAMAIIHIIRNGDKAPEKFVNKGGVHNDPSAVLNLEGKSE